MEVRTSPDFIVTKLREVGVRPQYHLGQNFLIDEKVLAAVVESGNVTEGDVVIEIGPGLGVLTAALIAKGAIVYAIEFDQVMIDILQRDFAEALHSQQLTLYQGDAVSLLPGVIEKIGQPYKVVANLPYQITTPVLHILLQERAVRPQPIQVALLVQRELAERLCAKARTGERSYLSVLAQYYTEPSISRIVPPEAFFPPPQVNSAILCLKPNTELPLLEVEEKAFFTFVRSLFQERRKQLKNVVGGIRAVATSDVALWFARHQLPSTVRAQELTQEDWLKLYHDKL